LKIYDLSGREVRTLVSGMHKKGRYSVRWDGSDNNNKKVGAGTYLYRLEAGDFKATKKMFYFR
jgi:flagellar hook assembly protein FlgD